MPQPDPDELRDRYARLIRQKGITSPQAEISARRLGVDVDGLLAEREREETAIKVIEIHLDLSTLAQDSDGVPQAEGFSSWASKVMPLSSTCVVVHLPGLGIYGTIPMDESRETTVAEVLTAGVRLILGKLRETPGQFRRTLPFGIRDIELERLAFSDSKRTWTLYGGRKTSASARTVQSLHPSTSIDLARRRKGTVEPNYAESWPELERVWLRVERWPNGTLRVVNAFEHPDDGGPVRPPTHPHLPETLTLEYPCSGEFLWDVWDMTTPATHFLREHSRRQAGDLAKDAELWGVEVVLCDYSKPKPAADPRASIRSGPDGPAPLPTGSS